MASIARPQRKDLGMAFRGGLGPVFAFEWLTAARRWPMYAWRSGFVYVLLCGLALVWARNSDRADLAQVKVQAEMADQFYRNVIAVALVMVLVAAPAATAGALCLDKARGTLFHVFVTDLSDAEIVLGKLAARLVPVLGLIACTLPVMALMTLLGGVDPVAVTGSFLVLLGMALLGCTLALTLSVWGKRTHDVLLATYFVWVVWALLLPGTRFVSMYFGAGSYAPEWVKRSHPFVLALGADDPLVEGATGLRDHLLFLAAAGTISTALVVLTIMRLRPVVVGQWGRAGRPRPGRSRWTPGPRLDGNPVLWREWHGRQPSRWARFLWGAYVVLALGFGTLAIDMAAFRAPISPYDPEMPALIGAIQVVAGLLLLSVSSATSLSEERSRGSLDVLLATPLSTASILWGKWWAAYRGAIIVSIVPTLIAAACCHPSRWIGVPLALALVLAYGAVITSLGLALATWIRRPGRVLVLCIAIYVGVSIGWAAWLFMLDHNSTESGFQAVMGSPFWGIGLVTIAVAEDTSPPLWPACAVGAAFWIAVDATIAALLMLATWCTFDRCMGRIPDEPAAAIW
jgi:ABC-type transport system involved in multi-copper enzyme maturation permease subunit